MFWWIPILYSLIPFLAREPYGARVPRAVSKNLTSVRWYQLACFPDFGVYYRSVIYWNQGRTLQLHNYCHWQRQRTDIPTSYHPVWLKLEIGVGIFELGLRTYDIVEAVGKSMGYHLKPHQKMFYNLRGYRVNILKLFLRWSSSHLVPFYILYIFSYFLLH